MRRIIVLSDIHSGSTKAPWHPDVKIDADSDDAPVDVSLNKTQSALFQAWSDTARKWHRPDVLIMNGEAVDGANPKGMGKEVVTTNLQSQIDSAVYLVEMFKAKQVFVLRGSDYHVELKGLNLDEAFARDIKAERIRNGRRSSWELYHQVEDISFNYAHHIQNTSSFMYRTTAAARELMQIQLTQSRRWPAQVIVRGHVHYFAHIEFTSHHAFIAPCWKLQDWFAYRRSAGGTVPDIGALRFTISGDKFDYEKQIYKLEEFKPPRVITR